MKKLFTIVITIILVLNVVMVFAACNKEKHNEVTNPQDNYFTVVFDSDGGTAVVSQRVKAGETAVKPEDPEKTATVGQEFSFVGWFVGETEFDFESKINADTTITAKWRSTDKYYDVIFDSDGGTAVANQRVKGGEKAVKPNDPDKVGSISGTIIITYSFDGWYLGDAKYDFNSEITESITLTARWKEEKYL